MKPVLSCGISKKLDAAMSENACISGLQLMEIASIRLWDALSGLFSEREHEFPETGAVGDSTLGRLFETIPPVGKSLAIVAVCGKGDNAGDTLAMLRHAKFEGFTNLSAILLYDELSESAKKNLESVRALGIRISLWDGEENEKSRKTIENADIVLDGILGTGLRGAVRGPAIDVIGLLNSLGKRDKRPIVVAVDLPSGLGDEWRRGYQVVKSDVTLAISPMKMTLFEPECRVACGIIYPVEKIFPEKLSDDISCGWLLSKADLGKLNCGTPLSSYKKTRGRLAIFAGSRGAAGAAILCSRSALAAGAGYVALFADEELVPLFAQALPSVMVRPFPEFSLDPSSWDCVLAGPGWGSGDRRVETMKMLLRSGLPLVLDADAIRLFASLGWQGRGGVGKRGSVQANATPPLVMTPHPGEFEALWHGEVPVPSKLSSELLEEMANRNDAVIVLKSHTTWIASQNGDLAVWDGMCPALGTAGSGDVLAGMIAGIFAGKIARKNEQSFTIPDRDGELAKNRRYDSRTWSTAFESAALGVVAHGTAGKQLAKRRGWFLSEDLIPLCSELLGIESISKHC
jgi:NAD(P)H-hydrate epimerase